MIGRAVLMTLLVIGGLLPLVAGAAASRDEASLRDQVYISPSWGYSVRWYEDEWSIADESSDDGVDMLWLRDANGSLIGFEGRNGYGGDARTCLDDAIANVTTIASGESSVVLDELDHPQKIYHPWRSWIVLLVTNGEDGQSDNVVYLDCRTLVPEQAVLIRYLIFSAALVLDDYYGFDPLNAALPRSAWAGDAYNGLFAPGLSDYTAHPPFPVDSILPWTLPGTPRLLATEDFGPELAMLIVVDGNFGQRTFVVMIENIGPEPITIDPSQFNDANDPQVPRPDPDIAPTRSSWDDGAPPGPRTLAPGTAASLTLEFPPLPAERTQTSFLVYWDSQAEGGAVVLECIEFCGFGAVGSRPKLRLSR